MCRRAKQLHIFRNNIWWPLKLQYTSEAAQYSSLYFVLRISHSCSFCDWNWAWNKNVPSKLPLWREKKEIYFMGCAFLAGGVCWVPTGCEPEVELVSSSSSDLWRHATLLHGQTKRSRSDACTDRGGCFRGWKRFPSFQRPVDWRDHGERAHLRPQWVCHHLRWQIWNKWQCRKFSCWLRLLASGRGGWEPIDS